MENIFVYLWYYSLQFESIIHSINVLRSLKRKQYLTLGVYNLNTFQMWHYYKVRKRTAQLNKYNSHAQHYIIYDIMMPCKVCDSRNPFRSLIYIHGVGCSVKPARSANFQFRTQCKKKKRRIINKTFPHLKRKTLTARGSRYKMSGNSLD